MNRQPTKSRPKRKRGVDLLARNGVQRLSARIDQRLQTMTDEIMQEAVMGLFTALAARQQERALIPARTRRKNGR
ncbi:MAG: hypothetical protein KJ871_06565 [Alphaproteobacteria bacterium]|nr:hypothetical protein [Alphaproteobacteria bacterium]MBU2084501.1 hypothetical protein [Alphaproteobacteria bacterium]MBU2142509.1 hypothetical protein [Alphaproteobacteria bacterium]MBU2197738.1 hypothetical protein [Alphaproteobacteria bacterium]